MGMVPKKSSELNSRYQRKLAHSDKLSSVLFCLDINLAVFPELPTYLGQIVLREFFFTENKCC